MNYIEKFLSLPINDHKKFAIAFSNAVKEIRAQELGIDFMDLMLEGDSASQNIINKDSIYPLNKDLKFEEISQHLKEVHLNWENSAIVYRGTRLPDNSGSFDFEGIHSSVQLNIAKGYASGNANSATGIGRLLKHNEGGFITSYKVPLSTKTYKNFEYEDLQNAGVSINLPSLQDLKNSLHDLSKKEISDFYLDNNDAASASLSQYYNLVNNQSHYETVLSPETPVHGLYFCDSRNIYSIDLNNPKWDLLLARLQEASLRDFYEIIPLEKLFQQIGYIHETSDNKEILEKAKTFIQNQKESFLSAPWECSSMNDISLKGSPYIESRPYITNSRCVGSTMNTCFIEQPEIIKQLGNLVCAIRNNNLELANVILVKIQSKNEPFIEKTDFINNISTLRKKFLSDQHSNNSNLTM